MPTRITRRREPLANLLDEIFLQPWYLSQDAANRVRECLPAEHRHKMRYYFEDYGCLKCGKKDVAYGSNAMCRICVGQTKLRLVFAIKRRWTANMKATERRPYGLDRMSEAQRLLKDIAARKLQPRPLVIHAKVKRH
jgi:hypothetical protein